MPIVDDLTNLATAALNAGATAARAQGAALSGDFENLVKPNLDDIVAQIAAITEDVVAGNIGADQAKDDLSTQMDRIEPLILTEAELALLAVQVIIQAVENALKGAVNTAAGVALL